MRKCDVGATAVGPCGRHVCNADAGMGGSANWLGSAISGECVAPAGFAGSNFEGGCATTTDGVNYRALTG